MFRRLFVAAALLSFVLGSSSTSEAGFPRVKVKGRSLGKYQQKTAGALFGAGVSTAIGGPLGTAAGVAAGNHAQRKWTGKGLNNWKNPKRW